ncbi:MAG: class I SAM-dependent methyltransferase [Candidatus Hydrogenedentes bacterium]|nr:class I SAM-dependent methyltransferase [Candidatus Hydrogenedentota bacterium]
MRAAIHRRLLWRIQRVLGNARLAWNEQFRLGVWDRTDCCEEVVRKVAGLAKGGKIVEFGCGPGMLPRRLPAGAFTSYTGIDIADYAIDEAKRLCAEAGLENCSFLHGDMASWAGGRDIDVIVLEECLYYLRGKQLLRFCEICRDSLAVPHGVALVIVHSHHKHRSTIRTCRKVFPKSVHEFYGSRTFLTLHRCASDDPSLI